MEGVAGMANQNHVAILGQVVEVWNQWRQENLGVKPELWGAYLEGADLSRADLSGADLSGVDLERADLSRADLSRADISRSNLDGAILTQARFGYTTVAAVDLRGVQDLDTLEHLGPSTIGLDTIERSQGQIPDSFLRGCGVSDQLIEAISLIIVQPIQYASCFISYSSHDEALAKRLHADLQAAGVRCWYASHDLKPGAYIVRGIDEAIRLHDKVVLLLSESSIQSNWVLHEIITAQTREAREGRIVLYPVRLDDTVLTTAQGWAAELRDARHIGDFRQWKEHDRYQESFARLLHDLRSERPTRA